MELIGKLSSLLWGLPMIITIMVCGILITIKSKFFAIRYFGHICKHTLGTMRSKESASKESKKLSPFEALCVAIGGAVGAGALGGVAAAVAVGGPGALFWLMIWAVFGMSVKIAEVTLACYYREKTPNGTYQGGPTYYILKGLGEEKGWAVAGPLAMCFGVALFVCSFSGGQSYTVAEAMNSVFGLPMLPFAFAYALFALYTIWKGTPRIAKFASAAVPFMCVAYFIGSLILCVMNYQALPGAIAAIFHDAFTGSAASGGFVGATVMLAIRSGVARSINSNEAGMGTSPIIHAEAETVHPVRQALWGSMEVFVNTFLVCIVTGLAILCSGLWDSGLTSVTLAMAVFENGYGVWGKYFIGIIVFLFGFTTTTGWYTYYNSMLGYVLRKNEKVKKSAQMLYKILYPFIGVTVVTIITVGGGDANTFWSLIDICNAMPVFFNVLALFGLSGTFIKLLNDYKARYLGVGKIDPNFAVFYEDKK